VSRKLGVLVLGALAVSVARADIPPPKGLKRISLEHKITTEKEFADYAFFAVSGGDKATAVKLDPKTPATVTAGGGRYRTASLVAVPKGAEKKFDSEKDFLAAVAKGTVEGMLKAKTTFDAFTTVKDSDPRKTIVKEYTLEKIDPKDGIVLTAKKDDAKDSPEESDDAGATAIAPHGGLWVAGMIASLGVLLAGLWLVTRCRGHRVQELET
jgi:hypothetical protein